MTSRRVVKKSTAPIAVGSRLGAMLSNRLGRNMDTPEEVQPYKGKAKNGAVVKIPKGDEDVLTAILSKAKTEVRTPRTGGNIHVSDLISRCIRKKAIVELNSIPIPVDRLGLMDALTYRQGEAIHDVIKERASAGAPAQVWGKWKCKCGSHKVNIPCTLDKVDKTVVCRYCDTWAKYYEEAEFVDPEMSIVGHPDLILWLAHLSAFYVTELKSISSDKFKDLVRPDPDHVIQVMFYWYIMRRLGMALVDTVSILYVTKGYTFRGSPFKEFTVHVPTSIKRLDPYIEDAKALIAARKGGALPPRVFCAGRESPVARTCEAAELCFGDGVKPQKIVVSYSQAISGRKR